MVRVKPAILISSFYVALSDLPHSRQQVLWRDVINPQNGHIRCDMKSRPPGLEVEGSFANESVMEASLLRKRSRSRRKLGSIHLAYAIFPSAGIACNEPVGSLRVAFCSASPAKLTSAEPTTLAATEHKRNYTACLNGKRDGDPTRLFVEGARSVHLKGNVAPGEG